MNTPPPPPNPDLHEEIAALVDGDTRLQELTVQIAEFIATADLPPEQTLAALAPNVAAIIAGRYRDADRPQVRVQFAHMLSGHLKRMDALKAAS